MPRLVHKCQALDVWILNPQQHLTQQVWWELMHSWHEGYTLRKARDRAALVGPGAHWMSDVVGEVRGRVLSLALKRDYEESRNALYIVSRCFETAIFTYYLIHIPSHDFKVF
jgi:hypothetical protein